METIPRIDEAVALARYMIGCALKPFYISFVCREDGEKLGTGETIVDATKALQPFFESELFWAFGINCTPISSVQGLLDKINMTLETVPEGKRVPKLIVYPNSGEVFSFDTYTWSGQSEAQREQFVADCEKCVNLQGVNIIGGCCRVTPK